MRDAQSKSANAILSGDVGSAYKWIEAYQYNATEVRKSRRMLVCLASMPSLGIRYIKGCS